MLPSSAASLPRIGVVKYPRGASRWVSVIAWIAGPPMFSREMIRTRRIGVTLGRGRQLAGAHALAEMLDGAAQPVAQPDHWLVTQLLARAGQVGQGVAHVAGAGRSVDRANVDVDESAQLSEELIERDRLATGNVVDAPWSHVRVHGKQIRLDHVFDVGEVSRLLAIAEDSRRPAGEHGADEVRDHRRVLRAWVLARPEHIEVAERHRLETKDLDEAAAIALRSELRH